MVLLFASLVGKAQIVRTAGISQGSRAALRNLNSKINRVDHDSLKQQEIIYNQVGQTTANHNSWSWSNG